MRHVFLVATLLVVFGALAQAVDPPREAPPAAAPGATEPAEEEFAFPTEATAPRPVPPPPSAGEAAPRAAAPAEAPAAAAEEVEDEVLPPLPPGERNVGPTQQRFDPTEKVRADFPVSFPVDI
ncbi:MAG: hypothetical protein MUC71_07285 [Steroidobacteraceae bacterium]|jgi:hypothetical protein|nr:hypothetical protein [Steroidobacteraceae bacterium]